MGRELAFKDPARITLDLIHFEWFISALSLAVVYFGFLIAVFHAKLA